MKTLICAKTGIFEDGIDKGEFRVDGLPLVTEKRATGEYWEYRIAYANANDGTIFDIWQMEEGEFGVSSADYYICKVDSAAPSIRINGGYNKGGFVEGKFVILAHGAGEPKALRLKDWVVAEAGWIKGLSADVAAQMGKQINERGRGKFEREI